jgi:hypothetical protein
MSRWPVQAVPLPPPLPPQPSWFGWNSDIKMLKLHPPLSHQMCSTPPPSPHPELKDRYTYGVYLPFSTWAGWNLRGGILKPYAAHIQFMHIYSPISMTKKPNWAWTVWYQMNPKPGGYINWRCRAARSRIWLLRLPIGERESIRHATAIVGSSGPSIRKNKRLWGWLKNCLVHRLLAGGVPSPGVVVVEGVTEDK